jgi:hypothetical protein
MDENSDRRTKSATMPHATNDLDFVDLEALPRATAVPQAPAGQVNAQILHRDGQTRRQTFHRDHKSWAM